MKKFEFVTLESVEDITPLQLAGLKEDGFCYVKIDEKLESTLKLLSTVGKDFFSRSEAEKQQCPHDFGVQSEGYLNHKIKGGESIQRYVYHGNKLVEPFLDQANFINYVRECFRDQIGLPVIKKYLRMLVLQKIMRML